jgi:glycosyltransferase A (GT-A) superfamily protein (DUF2064 family)
MAHDVTAPTFIVMAKPAVPGTVKTRLMREGGLTASQAAAVHQAMLDCVLERLASTSKLPGPRFLALAGGDKPAAESLSGNNETDARDPGQAEADADTQAAIAAARRAAHQHGWSIADQGTGDLGQRLAYVWDRLAAGGPVVFLGIDSPDVPSEAIEAIPAALAGHDAAVGAVEDGGYWTLAARAHAPALITGIDWGSERVYAQTRQAATQAGLTVTALPAWYDVDTVDDLHRLQQRLETTNEPALARLRERLKAAAGR